MLDSRTPTARAIAPGTRSASGTGARPTRCTGRSTAARAATSSARRLFPAPPGPVIGDESNVGGREQRLHAHESVGAADESMVECRKARRGQRLEGWKVLTEVGCAQLEELRRGRHVFESMAPERSERGTGKRLVACHVARHARDHDLLAVGRGAYARGDDHVHADVAVVAELGLARVDADPKPMRLLVRPRLGGERALDLRGCRRSRPRAREGEEHTVSRPIHLGAAVVGCRCTHELSHACACGGEALAEEVEEPRRSFDVREEERHGSGREIGTLLGFAVHADECKSRRTLSGRVRHSVRQAPVDPRRARP